MLPKRRLLGEGLVNLDLTDDEYSLLRRILREWSTDPDVIDPDLYTTLDIAVGNRVVTLDELFGIIVTIEAEMDKVPEARKLRDRLKILRATAFS